jgi:serine/threonine protein kinase
MADPQNRPSDDAPQNEASQNQKAGPFPQLPIQFGRYRIERLLGKGAMGAVYLAQDVQLDRPVALKVARISKAGSAKLIKRMETEAKAAANVDHPQICKVYDFGEIDGIRFIALQYIEGEDFRSYLSRVGRRREPAEAIRWIVQLANALEAAHEKGIIHRDLKPENVMINLHGFRPGPQVHGCIRRRIDAGNGARDGCLHVARTGGRQGRGNRSS